MKFYDAEFGWEVLSVLRKREILGRANPALFVPLTYNLLTKAQGLEQVFQEESQKNPLLETTPPEAWIAAELLPQIREIRENVEVDDEVLSDAVQKYLRHHSKGPGNSEVNAEQKLHTTICGFLPAIEKLLCDIFDRRQSLLGILALANNRFKVAQPIRAKAPSTLREAIIIQAIKEKWPHQKLAGELDRAGLKPKNKQWQSFRQMLEMYPHQFYSMKSSVKKKYLVRDPAKAIETNPQTSPK
jgi:hypothetical protein